MTFLNFETGENLCSINISFTHVDNNEYQLSYRLRFADGDIAQSCLNEILTNNNLRIHNEINSLYGSIGVLLLEVISEIRNKKEASE